MRRIALPVRAVQLSYSVPPWLMSGPLYCGKGPGAMGRADKTNHLDYKRVKIQFGKDGWTDEPICAGRQNRLGVARQPAGSAGGVSQHLWRGGRPGAGRDGQAGLPRLLPGGGQRPGLGQRPVPLARPRRPPGRGALCRRGGGVPGLDDRGPAARRPGPAAGNPLLGGAGGVFHGGAVCGVGPGPHPCVSGGGPVCRALCGTRASGNT